MSRLRSFQSATQHTEVLTKVLDPQPVRLGVMTPDRLFSRFDQSARQFLADLVRAVVDDPCKLFNGCAMERRRGWIARQNRSCELALESTYIPRELGKTKVDRSMQLPEAAGKVFREPLAQPR
jgi:hypothetical protein